MTNLIPEVPLGEIADIIGGGTPSKRNPSYYNGKIPWATVRDMNTDLLAVTEHSITEAGLNSSSSNLIPKGEVVIATRVGLGKACMLNQPTAINQDLRGVIPKPGVSLDRNYLHYWFKSIAKRIVAAGTGATVQGVKLPFIKGLKMPLPPLDEQKRIVSILDQAFEGLDRARANAEANLESARELFDTTLLASFNHISGSSKSLLLKEVCTDFGRGKSKHRPRNAPILYGGEYPFVQTGDIRKANGLLTEYSQTYSDIGLGQSKLWPKGTVCITIAANIAETAVLGLDACFPDSVIGAVLDPKLTFPSYVEYMLRYFATDLKALSKGSAQDNINLGTFENKHFPFPDLEVQNKLVSELDNLSVATSRLLKQSSFQLEQLELLRQSLLQKAFSGELT